MSINDACYSLYLVVPRGYPERTSVVVAENEEIAKEKAKMHPAINEIYSKDLVLIVRDLAKVLSDQGYIITVTKQGMFH